MSLNPINCLWLIDQNGFVSAFDLEKKNFEHLPNQNILFKCINSCLYSLWSVSCDHRLYVYFFSQTNKIEQEFEFYENQRWNPIHGFTNKLLPTDRPLFSDNSGNYSRPKDFFSLPSSNWSWIESDWISDDWLYASDFSLEKQFTPEKNIFSMVRKRRWHRTIKYDKLDQWVEIDSIFEDKYQDPIVDVAIGGLDALKDNSSNHNNLDKNLAVWVITISGKIYFKKNVSYTNPEGSEWVEVAFNENLSDCKETYEDNKIEEIIKISVGYNGIVWCVSSCGKCLVRLGVTKENLMGYSWVLVEPPLGNEIKNISVGLDSVWAICGKNNELYFRKGLKSKNCNDNLVCAIGSGWLKMVNEMSYVSVNSFDQVWALDVDKKKIFFRMGIEPGEMSGKMWKLIAKINYETNKENNDIESENGSLNDLTLKSDNSEKSMISNDFLSCSSSVVCQNMINKNTWRCLSASTCLMNNDYFFKTNNYLSSQKSISKSDSADANLHASNSNDSISACSSYKCSTDSWKSAIVDQLNERFEKEMSLFKNKYPQVNDNGSWVKSASAYFMLNEAKSQNFSENFDSANFSKNLTNNSFVNSFNNYLFPTPTFSESFVTSDFIKCHLELEREGSNYITESGTLIFKFSKNIKNDKKVLKTNVVNLAEIIGIFSCCNILNFPMPNVLFIHLKKSFYIFSFDTENELNDWFKTLNAACNCINNLNENLFSNFHKPIIFLISIFGQAYAGFLFNDYLLKTEINKIKNEIDQNQTSQRDLKYKLHKTNESIKKEKEENLETLKQDIIILQKNLDEMKNEESILRKNLELIMIRSINFCTSENEKMYFMYIGDGNFKAIEFTSTGVLWALTENGTPMVYSAKNSNFSNDDSQKSLNKITDTVIYSSYENQRWFPIVGFQAKSLPTDRPLWSDETGAIEIKKSEVKLPSSKWHWLNDWKIDYCGSKTDEEGWQYAIDFPFEYHNQKKITDLARRRKWSRIAKLETSGPWIHLEDGSISLKSISMYDLNYLNKNDIDSFVILWAITADGEALCRKGVTKNNPSGINWSYVDCREKFSQISISGNWINENNESECFIQVWAVAIDGTAYLRHGVTVDNPEGTLWFHIEPYSNSLINKTFACPSNCFMLDDKFNFYFRNKIKHSYPEGLDWKKINLKFKIIHASFPSNDCNKAWALIEVLDKQKNNLELVVCQNFSNNYNITENYEFKWKVFIKNAFKYVSCS